jgi:hypothetical protein
VEKLLKYMKESELHFISRLPTYTLKNTLIRVAMVSLVGVLFLLLATNVTLEIEIDVPLYIYFQVIIVFVILSEVNVLFDNLAERFFPIPDKIKTRVLIHFLLSIIIGIFSILYFDGISVFENILKQRIVWLLIALGLIFIFFLIMVSIGLRITEKWIWSLKEIDRLKEAKLKSDFNSLQDQLNPHFLFNNLSVLKSMIIYDPKSAAVFTQNFTDVYRYVLQSSQKTTVKLSEELEFINAYIGIHKERLGDNLNVSVNISDVALEKELPPLSLQLLIENAIKHNVASKKNPLSIEIVASENELMVKNNVFLKETTYSTQKGLSNLCQRYEMLTGEKPRIGSGKEFFTVSLPLIG